MVNIIVVVVNVLRKAYITFDTSNLPISNGIRNAPNDAIPAASVTVTQPPKILVSTVTMSNRIGQRFFNDFILSIKEYFFTILGASSGFHLIHRIITRT